MPASCRCVRVGLLAALVAAGPVALVAEDSAGESLYRLDAHTHAQSGLMRPHFNALEFTDLRDGTFALDHVAAAWLRTRDIEKFAYAHR